MRVVVDIARCRKALDLLLRRGLEQDSCSATRLILGFAASSSLLDACRVFSVLRSPDICAWSAIIHAHAKLGRPRRALSLLSRLLALPGLDPDPHLFVVAIKACAGLRPSGLLDARCIHSQLAERGFGGDAYAGSALIDTYVKCGSLRDAFRTFCALERQDVVTFTCMLSGFVQHGCYGEAVRVFEKMQREEVRPNQASFVSLMKACIGRGEAELGMILHALIVEGIDEPDNVILNGLIDMYAKCGRMNDAARVFERVPPDLRDSVTWCTMLSGYLDLGLYRNAWLHIDEMQQQERQHRRGPLRYDQALLVCLLKACTHELMLCRGMMIHSFILMETGLASDVTIGNTLLDMYLRCGRYVEARRFFATMRLKNVVSWSTMSRQSKEYSTTTMMEDLLQAVDANGHKPNDVTYGCILSSCRDEAFSMAKTLHQFKDMGELPLKDRVFPVIESSSHDELWTITHYNCIVDHLGHFGHLNEAMDLLKAMPHKENEIGWTSLLSSCKMYSHVGLGNQCFERVKETEGGDKSSSYLLMESIYKARGMVHEAVKMESMRRGSVWNITGRATIELNNRMHEFCVGDSSHEMNREISDKLKLLHVHMKREGYMPRFELYGGDPSPEI